MLLFCVLVFLLTILDVLALHDIKQDYLSKYIIDYLGLTFSKEIPVWTSTTGEWKIVSLSLYSRFIFLIFNIIFLWYYINKVKLNN